LITAAYPVSCNHSSRKLGNRIDSAIVDYLDDEGNAELRHIFRLCAMAEQPISVAEDEAGKQGH
jgi:hypothetical protein